MIGADNTPNDYDWLTEIGIDGAEVQSEYNALAVAEFGHAEPADEDHFRLLDEAYRRVFARLLPSLKFGDDTTSFAVDGIDAGENPRLILISDASSQSQEILAIWQGHVIKAKVKRQR